MLKYSRYNHLTQIPDEDAFVLVNFRTGALVRLGPLQKAVFDQATELPESAKAIEKFRRGGFLVNYDELRHMRTQAFLASGMGRALGLTICPTLSCNFACPYCFEEPRSGRMSQETQDALVEFAREEMETYGMKNLYVTWFGGEPLLCPDIIESLSERFVKLTQDLGAEYRADIITNGWFLDEKNLRMLERAKVASMQITLDGPTPETNDSSRKEKSGRSSFKRIMENLRNLRPYESQDTNNNGDDESSSKPLPSVNLRCNVNKENAPLFDELREKIEAIARETGVDINPYPAKMGADDVAAEVIERAFAPEEYAAAVPWDRQLRMRAGANCYRRVYCMAQISHSYTVDEQGGLSKCWEAVGRDAIVFGNVRDFRSWREPGAAVGAWDQYYETLFPENDQECMDCKFFPLCMGGCPHKRITNRRECMPEKTDPDGYALARYREWQKNKAQETAANANTAQ